MTAATVGPMFDKESTHAYFLLTFCLAFSIEHLTFSNEFTPPASSSRGDAKTNVLQFGAKKYFIEDGVFHPYISAGIGVGHTHIDCPSGGQSVTEVDAAIVLHAAVGMELRFNNLSLMLEAKHLYFDTDVRQYDPTATGLLAGVGFNW